MNAISSNSMSNSSIVVGIRVSFTLSIDTMANAISSVVSDSMNTISSDSMSNSSIVVGIRVSFTLSIYTMADAISSIVPHPMDAKASNAIANVGKTSICSSTMNSISTNTIECISIGLGFRLSSSQDNQGKI